jgi:hypothetical protein
MGSIVKLERINRSDKVAIYSVLYDGETKNEFEKFIEKFGYNDKYKEDLNTILARIQKIEKDGGADRHFRYEGKMSSHLRALPPNIESSKLRLYCLCYAECILILGGGGVKEKGTRTWQDNPILTHCVEDIKKVEKAINLKINKKQLAFYNIGALKDIDIIINE